MRDRRLVLNDRFVTLRDRLLAVLVAGVLVGILWRWLHGPATPVFREPWPASKPWPPISGAAPPTE